MVSIEPQIQILDRPLDIWDEINCNPIGEEAVHLCDLTDVVRKYINWTSLLPRVVPFYAVKANDSWTIVRVLAALGTGFDCASKHEMKLVLGIGVSSDRIIFAHPSKLRMHLKFAVENGVTTMTFDNADELHKIKMIAPNAKLVVRIRCDATSCLSPLGDKFGCCPSKEVPRLLELAKSLNLDVIGVSFHVGSGCLDLPFYGKAIYQAKKVFKVAEDFGYNFTLLDLGGGFLGDKENSLIECASIINTALDTHFPDNNVQIIAEPGRYFVTTSSTVMTKIHSKRQILSSDGVVVKNIYYINDGIYGTLSAVFNENRLLVPILLPTSKVTKQPMVVSTIWGPTTDNHDKVVDTVMLPDLQIDDVIAFDGVGSYSTTISTGFNGQTMAKCRYFIERSTLNNCPTIAELCQ